MALQIGAFQTVLGMDNSSYRDAIIESEALNEIFGESVTTFITNPLLGAVQVAKNVATGLVDMGKGALSNARELKQLEQQTGLSLEVLQTLRAESESLTGEFDLADDVARSFAQALGELRSEGQSSFPILERNKKAILALGDNESSKAFEIFLSALAQIEDQSRRTAEGNQATSEEAGKLLSVLTRSEDALKGLTDQYQSYGAVLGDDVVNQTAELAEVLNAVQVISTQLGRGLLTELFAAFGEEADFTTEGVRKLAEEVSQQLVPQVRELGAELGNAAEQLKEILDTIEQVQQNPIARLIEVPFRIANGFGAGFQAVGVGFDALNATGAEGRIASENADLRREINARRRELGLELVPR